MKTVKLANMVPLYAASCPNCGGPIHADRLEEGLVCRNCLSDSEIADIVSAESYHTRVRLVGERLSRKNMLKAYSLLYTSVLEIESFRSFFRKITGSELWSAQLTWAKRLLQEESLAIVAPTGVGKTTLLSIYALYRALEGAKVYYMLPTENLARQVEEKLRRYIEKLGSETRVVSYYSTMPSSRKNRALEEIEKGEYDILVTTTSFLSRRWSLLNDKKFDIVIVDDVDAVLRNSKNIDRILLLLGFDEETVEAAYSLVRKKIAAVIAKATGNIRRYEQILEEIRIIEARIASKMTTILPGQLVIASATGRSYGLKPKVFRELLGFEIGKVYDYTRSVTNIYKTSDDPLRDAVELVARMGAGGLVFVSKRYGKEAAKKLVEELRKRGVKAGLALAGRRVLEKFAQGDYDVLVGVASYYGVIVRGVDMPQRVIYTVFVGVPGNTLDAVKALSSPYRIVRAALELGMVEPGDELVRAVARLSPGEATALRIALANGDSLEGRLGELLEALKGLRRKLAAHLEREVCGSGRVREVGGLIFRCGDGLVAETVDAATYVQASGRASRMLKSRMTHGLSIVIETDEVYVKALERKLSRFVEGAVFEPLSEEKLTEELKRARLSRVEPSAAKEVHVETSLIIVESPTKAKTIASFFGRPVRRRLGSLTVYETTFYNEVSGKIHVATITASAGHVYDLSIDDEGVYGVIIEGGVVSPVYKHIKRCLNCGHQFSSDSSHCPRCGSSNIASKEDIVATLRQLAMENELVYIATDPDIEGEKIAYDIYATLRPYARDIKRIEMHAITRREFMRALASARRLNYRMVEAQMLRRIEDRWIGFGLSQRLWQVFGKNWLGAGRVQTPVLGWIIERYGEWRHGLGYNLYIRLSGGLRLRLHYPRRAEAENAAREAIERGVLVKAAVYDEREVNPPPPFTTETLLYEASKRYGYTAQKTMRIAQELFEAGLITYHRTDSSYVSPEGISVARQYLTQKGLESLFTPRHWGSPGHHEAIRPTRPLDVDTLRRQVATGELKLSVTLRESHYRLYDLIFRRFVASQMSAARIKHLTAILDVAGQETRLDTPVEIIRDGWVNVASIKVRHELASITAGARLQVVDAYVKRGSTIQLFSHGDVVALMKQRGLGRPSTYAKIIDSIKRHGYVIESKYRKKLVPTKLGIEVHDYLYSNFKQLVSEDRTRKLLEEIEAVSEGRESPLRLIAELVEELEELIGGKLAGTATAESGDSHLQPV